METLTKIGFNFCKNIAALKTDAQIMDEIQSMASWIMKECTQETSPGKCSYIMRYLQKMRTVSEKCYVMDSYIVCQDDNCNPKSNALKKILTDSMEIPYCTQLMTLNRDPKILEIASHVAEMVNLCTLRPGTDCDLYQNYFFISNNITQACRAEGLYATCLEKNCWNPSDALSRKILEVKNDKLCEYYQPQDRTSTHMPGLARTSTDTNGCNFQRLSGLALISAAIINFIRTTVQ